MHRLYEWLKALWQEKINLFIKGSFGGGIISGIFLFGSPFHSTASIIIEGLLKITIVGISAIVSGCATVLGNDLAAWMKIKWKKFTTKRASKIRKKKPHKTGNGVTERMCYEINY